MSSPAWSRPVIGWRAPSGMPRRAGSASMPCSARDTRKARWRWRTSQSGRSQDPEHEIASPSAPRCAGRRVRTEMTQGRKMAKTARLVVVLLLAAAAAAEANPQGSYRIAAGDLLEVIVWRNKELSMPVTVRPDGWISYPLVSDLQAAGLTPVELQHKLENAFASVVTT